MKNITKSRGLLLLASALAITGAACRHNDTAMTTPGTVTSIVAEEIAANTTDTASPIVINDLPISTADTDDVSPPQPVN